MTRTVERTRSPGSPAEPARRDPVPVGPASNDPARALIAAIRALPALGMKRAALERVARDLERRLHDPMGLGRTAHPDAAPADGKQPDGKQPDGKQPDGKQPDGPPDHELAPVTDHRLDPALAPPLRAPDAIVLSGAWLGSAVHLDELARRQPPEDEPPIADDEEPPRAGEPRAPRRVDPDGAARRQRPGRVGLDGRDGRRRGAPPMLERTRAARERERDRVKQANAKLDRYPVPKPGDAKPIAPIAAPPKGDRAALPKPPTGAFGKDGKPAVAISGGLEGTGAAASVEAWKTKVDAKSDAVQAAKIDDGDKYVLTFHQGAVDNSAAEEKRKRTLIQSARAAVKPCKELEQAPAIPDPDPLPAARKLVDDLFPKPLAPDTLPKLDRTPFGTIAELGTFVADIKDPRTGQSSERILRELGVDAEGRQQYAEIQIVGFGKEAPGTLPGFKSEVRKPDSKPGATGTLEERVTALNQAQAKLVLKANPKAGGPITLDSDLPMQAAVVPPEMKVDVASILAKVLATPNRYAKQITDAAQASFPGNEGLPAGYADQFIGDVVGDLTADLDKVKDAAKIGADDLKKALDLEATKVEHNAEEQTAKTAAAAAKAQASMQRETKLAMDHVYGLREGLDHWLDDIAAETKGGYEAQPIKDERDRLIDNGNAKVKRWIGHWNAMKESRHKHLGEAAAKRMAAYGAAAEMDRRRLAVEGGIDVPLFKRKRDAQKIYGPVQEDMLYTPAEQEYANALDKLDTWLTGAGPGSLTVRETELFEGLQSSFDSEADGAIQALKDAGTEAKRMIEQWATERLSKEIGLLRKILNAILDWLGFARKDVDTWEADSVTDNNAVVAENNLFLAEAKLDYKEGLTAEKLKAMKGLTEAQRAILDAYFVNPSTKGDAVAALAAGLVASLKQQRVPVVHRKIELKVLKDTREVVVKVANARGRIDVQTKAEQLEIAMKGNGTEEQKIFNTLAGLDPIEARAIELYYEQVRPGRSLRLELREELYDAGEQLWGSTHDYDRARVLLDAKPSAKTEALTIELDQTMKGGVFGIGTNKKKLFELMRNRSAGEIAAIKRWYKRTYGRDFEATVDGELDDGISPYYDKARFDALMRRDTKTADALGLRSALGAKKEGGSLWSRASSGIANWITRDKDDAVGTFDTIKDDIKADAKRWGWTIQQQKDEYQKRVGGMEGEFNLLFADEYLRPGDPRSAMQQAFGQSFGFDEARLLEGKRTDNLALISAATVSIEHKAWILPSKKKIDDTLALQYRTAFDDAMWDLELGFEKRKQKELSECTTPEQLAAVKKRWSDPEWRFNEHKALEAQAHQIALVKGGQNMAAMKAAYDKDFTYGGWTHGSFEKDMMAATAPSAFFANLGGSQTRNLQTDKTFALIQQGGYLSGEQLLYFGVKGAGTNEDDVKYAQAGKTRVEIDAMYLRLADRLGYSEGTPEQRIARAKDWVNDDFSGRELVDTKLDQWGVAVTPAQKVEKAKYQKQLVEENMKGGWGDRIIGGVIGLVTLGPVGAVAGFAGGAEAGEGLRRWISKDELAIIDNEIGRLDTARAKVDSIKAEIAALEKDGKWDEVNKKYTELDKQYRHVELMEEAVQTAFELQRKTVDALVDLLTTIVQIVVTIVGIALTPFTGGASLGLIVAMAVITSVVTSALNIMIKAALKGGDYGWEEFAVDAALAVIEAVAAALTANLGDKFLKGAFLANLVKKGLLGQVIGRGLANGLEAIIQSIPGALFGAIANDATWNSDNPFLSILGAVAQQAAMAGAMSGAMSGAMTAYHGLKGPKVAGGAVPELPTAKELAAARGSHADVEAMFKGYQAKKPGASLADFRVELDETILRMKGGAGGFADPAVQQALRGQLLDGLPAHQHGPMAEAKVVVLERAKYDAAFGTGADAAVVRWSKGKPVVFVPAGTDFGALAKGSPHLFEPPGAGAPRTQTGEGAPRARGASASNDPHAPAIDPRRPVIKEPYSGPNLESAIDIAAKNPGAHVIATEATMHPSPAEIARGGAHGVTYHPDNLPGHLPNNSIDEIKMRFPLPHDDASRAQFMRHLAAVQSEHPKLSGAEQMEMAMRRIESATGYAPYALERLKPRGTMEVVFWEPRIADELRALQGRRWKDPVTGKTYQLEIVSSTTMPKSAIAPHSGYLVPIGPHDPVSVVRLRKVEVATPHGPGAHVEGRHSGRGFEPGKAGGEVRRLDYEKIKFTDKGIDAVERHLARFEIGDGERAMIDRLRRIAKGEIPATPQDKAFYSHELRESVRYRKAGYATGVPSDADAAHKLWNDAHTATLEDYRVRERDAFGRSSLYHPDADFDAPAHPTGGRGPAAPEAKPVHPWSKDQPLGFRPDERLPPELRAAVEAELARSRIVQEKLQTAKKTLADYGDGDLVDMYNAYRRRLKVERPGVLPDGFAEGVALHGEGGRCPDWVWVAAARNAGWTGAVADFPGRVAGLIHALKNPITGTPLLMHNGSPAALAWHASTLAPGTHLYISARTKNGALHALLGVVQPDGSLHVMHGPSGSTRLGTPHPGTEIGPFPRHGPGGEVEIGTRVYDVKTGDLGNYSEHKWWVIDVPPAPARVPRLAEHVPTSSKLLADGESLAPKARRNLELELQAAGHSRETLRLYDDNQLLAAHGQLQVELAPKRVAAFREGLDWRARGELDALIDAPHLQSKPVAGEMETRLGDALNTKVEVDPRVPFGEVRVVPEVGRFGIVRGVKVVVGPGATVAGVLAHIPTLHQYKRMVGVLGSARRAVESVNRVLRGGGALPVEARAHEAWRELQKLPPMIEGKVKQLRGGNLDVVERVRLELEIESLERQLARHVNDLGDLKPGRGYVAAEGADVHARAEMTEPGHAREHHWQDTMGHSVDPSSPNQSHVAAIEHGVAEVERLVPGLQERYEAIRKPVLDAQDALAALRAEQQRLFAEAWKFNAEAQSRMSTSERARAVSDQAAHATIEQRIKAADQHLTTVRDEALAKLTEEMKQLHAAMRQDTTPAQRRAATEVARDFPLSDEAIARLKVLADKGIDAEGMLRRFIRDYNLASPRGPTDKSITIGHNPNDTTHYSNVQKRINFGTPLAKDMLADLISALRSSVFHEFTHHWEYRNKTLSEISHDWRAARSMRATGGLDPVKIKANGVDVDALLGNFMDNYVGRLYPGKPSTEVFTYAMEYLHRPDLMAKLMAADPEHFFLIMGVRK